MAKKMETTIENLDNINLDTDTTMERIPIPKVEAPIIKEETKVSSTISEDNLINCLRNERVIVRFIRKPRGKIDNPRHVLYGGMAENAIRIFVVPKLASGMYVNVLTDDEKNYLEYIMGLEKNALSVYKKINNFWDDSNENGINRVRLTKHDLYLDLSSPGDYIKYKILLANKNSIAASLQDLQDRPKETYQYVIIEEGSETKLAKSAMSTTMKCYKEFGKIENDYFILKTIIETIEGRPLSSNSKLEFLQTKINDLIQANGKTFLATITDPLLPSKVLIKKGVEAGAVYKRGDFYYLAATGEPLCQQNEEPTLSVAAAFLNLPKNQEIKFAIEAKTK